MYKVDRSSTLGSMRTFLTKMKGIENLVKRMI